MYTCNGAWTFQCKATNHTLGTTSGARTCKDQFRGEGIWVNHRPFQEKAKKHIKPARLLKTFSRWGKSKILYLSKSLGAPKKTSPVFLDWESQTYNNKGAIHIYVYILHTVYIPNSCRSPKNTRFAKYPMFSWTLGRVLDYMNKESTNGEIAIEKEIERVKS